MPIYLQICAIFSSKAGPSKVCLAESCQRTRQNLIKPELKFSESLCDIIQFFISPLSAFCSTFFLLLIFYPFAAFYFSAEQTSIGICYYFWFCFTFFLYLFGLISVICWFSHCWAGIGSRKTLWHFYWVCECVCVWLTYSRQFRAGKSGSGTAALATNYPMAGARLPFTFPH